MSIPHELLTIIFNYTDIKTVLVTAQTRNDTPIGDVSSQNV